ncbi:hypothetical protein AS592_09555 [Sulfurovum riftiae]|uniref:Uncharacterized protein n=1 Tax=Sulfurovum riftiae TaxID=1630136 RepID=A0A151CIM1_9BACT|nr:hypothetical protein AS592_09555 [Sulfurovum riftiae]
MGKHTAAAVAASVTSYLLNVPPKHEGKAECDDKLQYTHVVVACDEVLDGKNEHDDGDDEAHL